MLMIMLLAFDVVVVCLNCCVLCVCGMFVVCCFCVNCSVVLCRCLVCCALFFVSVVFPSFFIGCCCALSYDVCFYGRVLNCF